MSKEGLDLSDFDISGSLELPEPPVEETEVIDENEEITSEEEEKPAEEVDEETPAEESEVEEVEEEEEEPAEEPTANVEEEAEEESDLDLSPLFELTNRDIPVELDIEKYDTTDEESLAKFINDAIEANSKPTFASEEVEKINAFVSNGGRVEDFYQTMYGEIDYSQINLEDNDSAQKDILRLYLEERNPNRDEAWIEKKIERYENSGILAEEAEEAKNYLVVTQEKTKAELADKQARAAEEAQARYEAELEKLQSSINEQSELLGISLDKTKKQKFYDFLTKRDKYGKTEYMKRLESVPEASLNMAMLAFQNFDLSSITKAAETKTTKKLKKSLSRFSSSNQKGGTGSRVDTPSSRMNLKDEFGV